MRTRRKVLIIGSAHPLRGGLAAFNERLAQEYRLQGDDVTICSFRLQYPSLLFPGKSQYTQEPPPAGLTIHSWINSINPLNWIRIGRRLRKMNPDLVIVKFWMPFMAPCLGTICRIIRKNHHSRIISIIDNIIPHEHRLGDKALAAWFTGSVDGFITMSRSVLEELNQFDQQKPKLFSPHPLYDHFGEILSRDQARKNLDLPVDGLYILFFGFIRDYKGLDLLLEAMADDRLRKLPLKLIVAGEFYTNPKPYLDFIQKRGISEQVILHTEFIPDTEVASCFCAANLVVQPYKSATQSGVTQIAYHFNKPMIITNVGGLAEFVPDHTVGYVVEPTPSAIAGAIFRFFTDEKEGPFSVAASIEKKKYGWQTMVQAINTVIQMPYDN